MTDLQKVNDKGLEEYLTASKFVLNDNKVAFPIKYVAERFVNGEMGDDFNWFSKCGTSEENSYTDIVENSLHRQWDLREQINKVFNTRNFADTYAIGLYALFFQIAYEKSYYQKGTPYTVDTFASWREFSREIRFDFRSLIVDTPDNFNHLECMCGHDIHEVYLLFQDGYDLMLGSDCVMKSSISNYFETRRYKRVDCSRCGKYQPKPKLKSNPVDMKMCNRCNTYTKKHLPPPLPQPELHECITCSTNTVYKPRCNDCYFKLKNVPFIERRTL